MMQSTTRPPSYLGDAWLHDPVFEAPFDFSIWYRVRKLFSPLFAMVGEGNGDAEGRWPGALFATDTFFSTYRTIHQSLHPHRQAIADVVVPTHHKHQPHLPPPRAIIFAA
jgi:hypothetical protein